MNEQIFPPGGGMTHAPTWQSRYGRIVRSRCFICEAEVPASHNPKTCAARLRAENKRLRGIVEVYAGRVDDAGSVTA